MSRFGFEVTQLRRAPVGVPLAERGQYKDWPLVDEWTVHLPHQCDAWEIAQTDPGGYASAVADLEEFIAEAQEALVALKERREVGGWSEGTAP